MEEAAAADAEGPVDEQLEEVGGGGFEEGAEEQLDDEGVGDARFVEEELGGAAAGDVELGNVVQEADLEDQGPWGSLVLDGDPEYDPVILPPRRAKAEVLARRPW